MKADAKIKNTLVRYIYIYMLMASSDSCKWLMLDYC